MSNEIEIIKIEKEIKCMEAERVKALRDGFSVTAEMLSGKIRKVKEQKRELKNG